MDFAPGFCFCPQRTLQTANCTVTHPRPSSVAPALLPHTPRTHREHTQHLGTRQPRRQRHCTQGVCAQCGTLAVLKGREPLAIFFKTHLKVSAPCTYLPGYCTDPAHSRPPAVTHLLFPRTPLHARQCGGGHWPPAPTSKPPCLRV